MVLLTVPFDPNREGRVQPISRAGALVLLSCFIGVGVGLLIEYSGSPTRSLGRGLAGGAGPRGPPLRGGVVAGRQRVFPFPLLPTAVVPFLSPPLSLFHAGCAPLLLPPSPHLLP